MFLFCSSNIFILGNWGKRELPAASLETPLEFDQSTLDKENFLKDYYLDQFRSVRKTKLNCTYELQNESCFSLESYSTTITNSFGI